MPIEEGKKAPPFSLLDESGNTIKLGDSLGKWGALYVDDL